MTTPLDSSREPISADQMRALWRAEGGTIYSAPRCEMAVMPERTLLAFLATHVGKPRPAEPLLASAGPAPDTPSAELEASLRALVAAVCPGLDTGDLVADARTAAAAMASAEPVAYFGLDEEEQGRPRFFHVADEFKADDDVFPLYRRAARVDEVPPAAEAAAEAGTPAKKKGRAAA